MPSDASHRAEASPSQNLQPDLGLLKFGKRRIYQCKGRRRCDLAQKLQQARLQPAADLAEVSHQRGNDQQKGKNGKKEVKRERGCVREQAAFVKLMPDTPEQFERRHPAQTPDRDLFQDLLRHRLSVDL